MKTIDLETEKRRGAGALQRSRKHGEDLPVPILARVRATIRNTFSAFKRRKAEEHTAPDLTSTSSRNCILPTELLASIFEEGACLTWPNDAPGTPFAMTVSHVCRHWRVAACSTSRLWAHIYVYPGRDDMTRMFLARAGQFPLHICFYIYGRQMLLPCVSEAIDLIRPSSPRWETLYVYGEYAQVIYVAWIHLHTMPRMPHLRRIELCTSQVKHVSLEWTPENTLTEQKPDVEKALLNGFTSLVLRGISGHMISLLCKALNIRDDPFPPYADISSRPLPLTYLRLAGSMLPWVMSPREEGHIVLPCLQTLEIVTQENALYIQSFFKAIAAPALQTLCFASGSRATWEGFESALPGITASFRELHTLHLKVSDAFTFNEPGDPAAFGARLDHLRQLTLEVRADHQAVHFLHAWFRGLSDGGHGMWAQLEVLAIDAPCDSEADTFGASEIDHYVTLLGSLSLASCVGRPLDVWLNSKCVQFLISHPLGRDVRCGFSVLHRHGLLDSP